MNNQIQSLLELGEIVLANSEAGHHIVFLSIIFSKSKKMWKF